MPAVKGGGGDKAVLFGDLGERRVGEGGGGGGTERRTKARRIGLKSLVILFAEVSF